ncbi:MAG: hypothetical protein M1823_004618 [Watsoniomyces obsoletus]|nr:MAG: hypothetical protein M1823_004618 [Watsoniomyces obsoletus]
MLSLRYLLPLLAAAGSAWAQIGCSERTNNIQNEGDAQALSGCRTVSGDIVIAEGAAGTIRFPGIERIEGSLICRDATNLNSIEAPRLSIIDRSFTLTGLTVLATLNFPSLQSVGSIEWTALPALQELSFTRQVTRANEVVISNTNLKSLNGINLEQVSVFDVNNNPYLTRIDVQLGNISQALTLQANSKDLEASFPNLIWAFNMTFRNCSEVNLPSLASVNGSLGFYGNFFESFAAPNLTRTGDRGAIAFVSNEELTNISMPMLTSIGGTYQIANNTKLRSIDGFPKLSQVGGAIDFSGNFTNVTLSSIRDVRGAFNLQTSSQFDCSPYQQLKNSGVVKGRYTCSGSTSRPGSVTSGSGGSQTSSGASPSQSAAARHIPVHVGAVLAVCAALSGWLFLAL